MLTLNVYSRDQKTVIKTVTASTYDLTFGVLDDVIGLLDVVGEDSTPDDVMHAIAANWSNLKELLLVIYPDLEPEDLRNVKLTELVPVAIELVTSVVDGLGAGAKKKIQAMLPKT